MSHVTNLRGHDHVTSKRKSTNRSLRFECLEGRTMMSVTSMPLNAATDIPAAEFEGLARQEATELRSLAAMGNSAAARGMTPPKAYVDAGTLIIQGFGGDDDVRLTVYRGGVVGYAHYLNGESQPDQKEKFDGVTNIVFLAYDGNNSFYNNTRLPSKAVGGVGVDRFIGGHGDDVFYGLGGNDLLDGGAGSDRLYGGTGQDVLKAGGGTANEKTTVNILKGGAGHDHLFGSIGFDKIYGNGGNDKLRDDSGHGYLHGGAGDDVLFGVDYSGGTQKLEIHGGSGKNTIIVKKGIHEVKLLTSNDYDDDDIFLPKNKSLKTVTMATVNKLLS